MAVLNTHLVSACCYILKFLHRLRQLHPRIFCTRPGLARHSQAVAPNGCARHWKSCARNQDKVTPPHHIMQWNPCWRTRFVGSHCTFFIIYKEEGWKINDFSGFCGDCMCKSSAGEQREFEIITISWLFNAAQPGTAFSLSIARDLALHHEHCQGMVLEQHHAHHPQHLQTMPNWEKYHVHSSYSIYVLFHIIPLFF